MSSFFMPSTVFMTRLDRAGSDRAQVLADRLSTRAHLQPLVERLDPRIERYELLSPRHPPYQSLSTKALLDLHLASPIYPVHVKKTLPKINAQYANPVHGSLRFH